jgi:hypothetical protein
MELSNSFGPEALKWRDLVNGPFSSNETARVLEQAMSLLAVGYSLYGQVAYGTFVRPCVHFACNVLLGNLGPSFGERYKQYVDYLRRRKALYELLLQ